MGNFLIFTTGIFLSFSNAAIGASTRPEPKMDLICVSELPTTSFIVQQNGDVVDVQVINHNGIQYAPIRNALVTPNDIPSLQDQASTITKLGPEWHFKWKRSACNADSPLFFQCISGAEPFESNGVRVRPFAISVSDIQTKTFWSSWTQKNISLQFNIGEDRQTYEITMNYQNGECIQGSDGRAQSILQRRSK